MVGSGSAGEEEREVASVNVGGCPCAAEHRVCVPAPRGTTLKVSEAVSLSTLLGVGEKETESAAGPPRRGETERAYLFFHFRGRLRVLPPIDRGDDEGTELGESNSSLPS